MLTSSSSGSLIRRVGHEEAFSIFETVGLEAMDYPVDSYIKDVEALEGTNVFGLSEEQVFEKFTDIREIADRHHVKIGQTHAAFGRYEPSITDGFLHTTLMDIVATAALGAPATVIHPIVLPGRKYKEKRQENFELNMRFLGKLVPYLEKYHVKAAVENVMVADEQGVVHESECSDPNDLVRYMEELGDEDFCVCPDLGHFSLTEKDTGYTVGDCLRVIGKHVGVVHIQETDRIHDSHVVPYSFYGSMDWDDIIQAFRDIDFKGVLNFEVMPYIKPFPTELLCSVAMRHISDVAHYMAKRIEAL